MYTHFNKLSAAEQECLSILMEECGETIHIIGKILRHGYSSIDPTKFYSPNNRTMLEKELGDVLAAVERLALRQDIDIERVQKRKLQKLIAQEYLHHNPYNTLEEYK